MPGSADARLRGRMVKFMADEEGVHFPANELLILSFGSPTRSSWLHVPWTNISNLRVALEAGENNKCVAFDVTVTSAEAAVRAGMGFFPSPMATHRHPRPGLWRSSRRSRRAARPNPALDHRRLGGTGPFPAEIRELAAEGLIAIRPNSALGEQGRYWLTDAVRARAAVSANASPLTLRNRPR